MVCEGDRPLGATCPEMWSMCVFIGSEEAWGGLEYDQRRSLVRACIALLHGAVLAAPDSMRVLSDSLWLSNFSMHRTLCHVT